MQYEPITGPRESSPPTVALPRRSGLIALVLIVGTILAVLPRAKRALDEALETPLPVVASIDPATVFWNFSPVRLTVWTPTMSLPYVATRDQVRTDQMLWRRMRLENWSAAPVEVRRDGLDAMLAHYAHLLKNPAAWDRMTAHDWDQIPQPVRVVAYRHMVEYWSGYYGVGDEHDLPSGLVAQTLTAIVMSESWFEHRAQNVGFGGQRDFGLAQASEQARERMREMYRQGQVDVYLADRDYFNPWVATRFVAIWMKMLLDQVDGDLDTAIRAYNRGVSRAFDERGTEYLAAVKRRLHRFIQNRESPPAWRYVWRNAPAIRALR